MFRFNEFLLLTLILKDSNGKTVTAVRRFSDFEWLHQRLADEFLDVLVPPIPEKQIISMCLIFEKLVNLSF